MLEPFLRAGADTAALTLALAPQADDFALAFEPKLAQKAASHYAGLFETFHLTPNQGQTELLVWKVTTAELHAGTGDASKCDPSYRDVAAQLRPAVTWYCFKFVVPAEKQGTGSEGLSFVRGRWVLLPAPWAIP